MLQILFYPDNFQKYYVTPSCENVALFCEIIMIVCSIEEAFSVSEKMKDNIVELEGNCTNKRGGSLDEAFLKKGAFKAPFYLKLFKA